MNEKDQFLQDTENILEQPITEESTDSEATDDGISEETAEETEQKLRNRKERRLAAKYQAERESSIALAARLEAITEARKPGESEADHFTRLDRVYGTDTPEALAATEILRDTFKATESRATERALELFREEQRKERDAVRTEEASLDSMLDEIEDEYGVSMTKEQEKGFFRLLERFSPKDRDGNILNYADHHMVYEMYQETLKKPRDSRAKDVVSRGMTRSGSSAEAKVNQSAEEKFLKEAGII